MLAGGLQFQSKFIDQSGEIWFCPNCFETWELKNSDNYYNDKDDIANNNYVITVAMIDVLLIEHLKEHRECADMIFTVRQDEVNE